MYLALILNNIDSANKLGEGIKKNKSNIEIDCFSSISEFCNTAILRNKFYDKVLFHSNVLTEEELDVLCDYWERSIQETELLMLNPKAKGDDICVQFLTVFNTPKAATINIDALTLPIVLDAVTDTAPQIQQKYGVQFERKTELDDGLDLGFGVEETTTQNTELETNPEVQPQVAQPQMEQQTKPKRTLLGAILGTNKENAVQDNSAGVVSETSMNPMGGFEETPMNPMSGFEETPMNPMGGFGETPMNPMGGFEETPMNPMGGFEETPMNPMGGFEETPMNPMGGFEETPTNPMGGFEETPMNPMGGFEETPMNPMGGFEETPMNPMGGFEETPMNPMGGFEETPMNPMGGFEETPVQNNGLTDQVKQMQNNAFDKLDALTSTSFKPQNTPFESKSNIEQIEDLSFTGFTAEQVVKQPSVEQIDAPALDLNGINTAQAETSYRQKAEQPKIIERTVVRKVGGEDNLSVINNIKVGKLHKILIVTGDRGSGVTSAALSIARHFSKFTDVLYFDCDIQNHGVLNYLNYEKVQEFEEMQLVGTHACKTNREFPHCRFEYAPNLDFLTSDFSVEVSDGDLQCSQRVVASEYTNYSLTVVDCPLQNLHLIQDLFLLGDALFCIETSTRGIMNYLCQSALVDIDVRYTRTLVSKGTIFETKVTQKNDPKKLFDYYTSIYEPEPGEPNWLDMDKYVFNGKIDEVVLNKVLER